jgi:hypothetical protein
MYKSILGLLFVIITALPCIGQVSLNKDLLYGMSSSDAKAILAKDKSYASIQFSTDVVWSILAEDMIFENDQLKYIVLKPAGNFYGINFIKTLNHIRTSKEYLQNRNYTVEDEHPLWNRPQAYVNENASYVSLLVNKSRNLVVKIDVERFKGSYMPTLTITHLENMESFKDTKEQESSSGF